MKKIYILLLFIGTACFAKAQEDPPSEKRQQDIEALKVAFISKELDLTPGEAQKFWPVYNQYDNEIRNLQAISKNRNAPVIEIEEKLLNIRKKYVPSFDKVIGPQKLNKLFNAERDFRDILIHRLQNRNQQRLNPMRR